MAGEILSWGSIDDCNWGSLLLGNGFSIGISEKFKYDNLFDVACEIMGEEDIRELFSNFTYKTNNFEEVMKVIHHALLINNYKGFGNECEITDLSNGIKNLLLKSIQSSHVSYQNIETKIPAIARKLKAFKKVFTTNYDLIPYWAMQCENFSGFKDFFWSSGAQFCRTNVNVYNPHLYTLVYHLHGALYLRSDCDEIISKANVPITTDFRNIVDFDKYDSFPLFISEGYGKKKLHKILSNDYLEFCYNSLKRIDDGIVIYGHGLDETYDSHIIDALKESSAEKIAISVHCGMEISDKNLFVAKINKQFRGCGKNIYFFDSSTHPLGKI